MARAGGHLRCFRLRSPLMEDRLVGSAEDCAGGSMSDGRVEAGSLNLGIGVCPRVSDRGSRILRRRPRLPTEIS